MIKNGKNLVEEQNNQANNYVKNLKGEDRRKEEFNYRKERNGC